MKLHETMTYAFERLNKVGATRMVCRDSDQCPDGRGPLLVRVYFHDEPSHCYMTMENIVATLDSMDKHTTGSHGNLQR